MLKRLLNFLSSKISISGEYININNSGQIWGDKNKLSIYGFNNRDLEIGSGGNISINAGSDSVTLMVGNSEAIKITRDSIYITSRNVYINDVKINK